MDTCCQFIHKGNILQLSTSGTTISLCQCCLATKLLIQITVVWVEDMEMTYLAEKVFSVIDCADVQSEAHQRGSGSLVCTIANSNEESSIASHSIPDTLNLLVKWFALNNAGGESGPLVLIFAVPSMTENTFFATEVISMSSTTTVGDKGWIYFSQTRGGCHDMWVHYYLHVTVPTITLSNSVHLHTVCYLI